MAPMKTIKATKGSKAAVRAVPKTASAAALAEGHERKRGVCSKTIDSLATLAAAEMKPATKAGKRETFGKEVMVKAKPAKTVVKAFPVAAIKKSI